MDRTVHTIINPEICTGCGLCIEVCPSETISIEEGVAKVTGTESLSCGHCVSVCPTGAVRVPILETDVTGYQTFEENTKWLPHGDFDTSALVNLMASRRSCRNYSSKDVDLSVIEDLVKIGITAPSGSNAQEWTFTILPDRKSVTEFGDGVGRFFKNLNKTAEKWWLRILLKLIGKKDLEFYYQNYYKTIKEKLVLWEQDRVDLLFHGAPAAIIVGSRPDASSPGEDALLATQNILLAAHSIGLGTCLIGYAVKAMERDKSLHKLAGLPDRETAYSVIALGYPKEKYFKTSQRKQVKPRYRRL